MKLSDLKPNEHYCLDLRGPVRVRVLSPVTFKKLPYYHSGRSYLAEGWTDGEIVQHRHSNYDADVAGKSVLVQECDDQGRLLGQSPRMEALSSITMTWADHSDRARRIQERRDRDYDEHMAVAAAAKEARDATVALLDEIGFVERRDYRSNGDGGFIVSAEMLHALARLAVDRHTKYDRNQQALIRPIFSVGTL